MTESSGAITWAYGLLSTDATLIALIGTQIYESLAPQGTTGDYLILQQQAYNEDGTSLAGDIGAGRMMLTVKAVTQSAGYASAEAIFAAAHTALNGKTGTATGVTILSCVRDSIIRYTEIKDGIRYNHLGAMYRLFVSPS